MARVSDMNKPYAKPKIIVMGYARHGKDTVCEMLATDYGLNYMASSLFCAERLLFPLLKDKYGYETVEQCFEDRHNHRAEWYEAIRAFNDPDLTKLGRAILAEHDMYCGIRNHSELHALKIVKAYDFCIWVDASRRQPPEDRSSCTVEPWMADFVLDNNGSLENLAFNLRQLYDHRLKA